jgi:hypothetical protein
MQATAHQFQTKMQITREFPLPEQGDSSSTFLLIVGFMRHTQRKRNAEKTAPVH